MKKKFLAFFIIFLLFHTFTFISNASENKTDGSNERNYYALIIGIEKFIGIELPEEDHIDDDAIAMYELLLNSKNWKEENIKMILNENATKDKIQDAIVNWLGEKEDENDIVLIYHVGHGWKIPLRQRKYGHAAVLTYNETEEHRLEDRITDKEYDSYVDELDSKHITIILETCYSGKMFALRQRGRVILAAGGKYFFCGVDEDDTLGSGIFGYFLRQGFEGVADLNNDGWVTSEEAFRYARLPTIHFSIWKQFPFIIQWMNQTIIWFFQIPWMYDRHFGGIPLVQYQTITE
jgi:hypothetical protein